jgi:hypothetical protein
MKNGLSRTRIATDAMGAALTRDETETRKREMGLSAARRWHASTPPRRARHKALPKGKGV